MKLLELLVEKIKSFFNGTKVVAEVKVIQPKPAAIKKQEKPAEVVESTSPIAVGEEVFKQAQLDALAAKQAAAPAVVEAPAEAPAAEAAPAIIDATPAPVEVPAVVEEAPKKSKRKYYHKRKPKTK